MLKLFQRYSQFLTFALLGVVNTFIHGIILVWLVELFFFKVIWAHLTAFICANFFSYLVNSKFTFKMPFSLIGYYRFLMASLGALVLTLLFSKFFENLGFHYLIGFLFIIGVVPIITFFTLKFWAFAYRA